jgi:hypothetical protein
MCIICVELEMNRLTLLEARRNYGEMVDSIEESHREELEKKLYPDTIYDEECYEYFNFIKGTSGSD